MMNEVEPNHPEGPRNPETERKKVILIVEDDEILASTLRLILHGAGFRTERARTGQEALTLWRATLPDLLLLDLGLPELDGMQVLRTVRASSDVPVVILTARAEEADELDGLGLGADDYLVKPVTSQKLLAHLDAVMRRVIRNDAEEHVARFGLLEVDGYRHEARWQGEPIHLTPSEFGLLAHLAGTPGRAVSRSELYEAALPERDAYDRAVDVHVANLRRKLREAGVGDVVETVRGVGYRFREGRA